MKENDIKDIILDIEEIKLKSQLRAIREMRKGKKDIQTDDLNKRISQVDYVYMLLKEEKKPLHVTKIIRRVKEKFGVELYRESIVSALLKKVNRFDRFIKTDPNTFGLIEHRELYRSQKQDG